MTSKAFDLLLALVRGAGRTVTKSELMAALWQDTAVEKSNLTQTVFVLRKALGEDSEETGYIRTMPRQGYRFVAPVMVDGRPERAEANHGERRRFGLRPQGIVFGSIAFVAALIAGFISGALRWRSDPPMMRFSVDLGPEALRGIQVGVGAWFNAVISPDGTHFVFPAKAADGSERLATRRLDQSIVTMLAGTEGVSILSFLRMASGSDSSPARS